MPTPRQFLIIEDSASDAGLPQRELQHSGYEVTARRVETEADMLAALSTAAWDVILGDYSMPHFNGPTALRVLKQQDLDIPFIFVSGKVGERRSHSGPVRRRALSPKAVSTARPPADHPGLPGWETGLRRHN